MVKGSMWLIGILSLLFFSACSSHDNGRVDELNSLSYAYHYRSLDSVSKYAHEAFRLSNGYSSGKAEAYNNLAFVHIAKMQYPEAYSCLDSVSLFTDNQVELLVADVQNMRLCQRESKNKDFYYYRERAIRRMRRIEEESSTLSERMKMRYLYAQTEFSIVSSTYYYYVGLNKYAVESLKSIELFGELQRDTAQYLNYLYQLGSGGLINRQTRLMTRQKELECLLECYILAKRSGMVYWQANSLQSISEHLLDREVGDSLIANNEAAIVYLNDHDMPDSLIAGYLAQKALVLFEDYGDVYQIAGAYRTLSFCYWDLGDYNSSLICLERALTRNKAINRAPAQIASIRECLSIVYSAMNDKNNSDINRNEYLDIQEETRQDRQLEARAEQLGRVSTQLNLLIIFILSLILIAVVLFFVFNKLGKGKQSDAYIEKLLLPLRKWEEADKARMAELDDRSEEMSEKLALSKLQLEKYKRRSLDNKAKVFLVGNVLPYIDRIINEVRKLESGKDTDEIRSERLLYVNELIGKINEYNDVLTHWIQLQQGQINLKIESFNLMDVFDVLAKSEMSFKLKGINFKVEPSDVMVKADKVLTLFMLNTLADNARKFTPKGGQVCVNAVKTSDYVEISVKDTGAGLSDDELANIFNHKVYNGHGFGLLNCKGIIDKYKKVSNIFNVCGLFAESVKGKGSRFYFRLPYGVARCLSLFVFCLVTLANVHAGKVTNAVPYNLQKAGAFADSAYYNNVRGEFDKTLVFADSTLYYLNRHYWSLHPGNTSFMVMEGGSDSMPAELKWFHDGVKTNYDIILDIRNECAVAALALNEWDLYVYNNRVYTSLFKERSADKGLDDYCQTMQASSSNKIIAIIILALLLVGIVFAFYFLYYRHVLYFRFCVERIDKANNVLLSDIDDKSKLNYIGSIDVSKYPVVLKDVVNKMKETLIRSVSYDEPRRLSLEYQEDELNRVIYETEKVYISNNIIDNCLSTLKHETMYYPARIRQLVDNVDMDVQSVKELVYYYKELYTILYGQVKSQADEAKFNCAPVSLKDYVCVDDFVLFDEVLLSYLFDVLKESCGYIPSETIVANADGKYLTLRLSCNKINHTDTGNFDYFAPLVQNIPFLICRQIIREMAEITNMHGCGLRVVSEGCGATFVYITFARAHMFTELESKEMEQ